MHMERQFKVNLFISLISKLPRLSQKTYIIVIRKPESLLKGLTFFSCDFELKIPKVQPQ